MTIELLSLSVNGPNAETAVVTFGSPLTVISGSSGTGKSHVFQCIEYMLGGKDIPERIEESKPYDLISMDLVLSGVRARLERSFLGGRFSFFPALNDGTGEHEKETLKTKNDPNRIDNISQLLLTHSGLKDKSVRVNAWGKLRPLSFSEVRKLILVDEERIIRRGSVFLRGQRQDETVDKSVAGLLITGIDDSTIVAVEGRAERDSRLKAESSLLEELTAESRELIGKGPTELKEIEEQLERLSNSIDEATKTVSVTQAEISELEADRQRAWAKLREVRSRRAFLATQVERFSLLQDFYSSDRARLLAVLEAEGEVRSLDEADCPVCGRSPSETPSTMMIEETLDSFTEACKSELKKIRIQETDLAATIKTLSDEEGSLAIEEAALGGRLGGIDKRMSFLLEQQQRSSRDELQSLLSVRADLLRQKVIAEEVARLSERQEKTAALRKKKPTKPALAEKLDVKTTVGLCDEVRELLTTWKFPGGDSVLFDPEKLDFVIGRRNRGSLGKGYRAVAYSAVTIGLMRYCLKNKLPHPGFVVLDTPLNPLKGREEGTEGIVNEETKLEFYRSLASSNLGQVVVFENVDPQSAVQEEIEYHHFSQNAEIGRYGFYPTIG
ncbi:MAG: AAA family ATPase [Planctomycetota bacterium]